MLKIRLMRIGTAKRPFYRVVAVDERKKRTGGYLELLGTYNPLTEPKEIKLDQPKIDEWLKKGAQPSDGFLRIIGKAKQRPARPPKKQKKEEPAAAAPQEKPVDGEEQASNTQEASEDAPVVSEQSIAEAPEAEKAEAAAEVLEDAPKEETEKAEEVKE